jgi:UDP-glucose 4-epimerase
VLARHRLHRGVAIADVAAAHVLALAQAQVTGMFVVAGPLLFQPADAVALYESAGDVIRRRAPATAAAFGRLGWPLPHRLDRVYDSRAAADRLGYRPREDVPRLLG